MPKVNLVDVDRRSIGRRRLKRVWCGGDLYIWCPDCQAYRPESDYSNANRSLCKSHATARSKKWDRARRYGPDREAHLADRANYARSLRERNVPSYQRHLERIRAKYAPTKAANQEERAAKHQDWRTNGRVCTFCGEHKPPDLLCKQTGTGLPMSRCKACHSKREYARQLRQKGRADG